MIFIFITPLYLQEHVLQGLGLLGLHQRDARDCGERGTKEQGRGGLCVWGGLGSRDGGASKLSAAGGEGEEGVEG